MSEPIPIIGAEAILGAVDPVTAIDATREAFVRHADGEWSMPPKVYVTSPPDGDFRAMPAIGGGLAVLKWVTSYPSNPARGLPVVTGVLAISDASDGRTLAVCDCRSVTSLRTGAAAAVSAQVLATPGAASVGVIGCGINGAWAARCLVAAGYGRGVCADRDLASAEALAGELDWDVGPSSQAAAQDVVVTVTPGQDPVIRTEDLRPGQHLAVLGADAAGKAEVTPAALARCRLFCDEWGQAAGGGELAGPVARGEVAREQVTELGAVLTGRAPGREGAAEVTLFDSTGLAIQDLGIAHAIVGALDDGRIDAPRIAL